MGGQQSRHAPRKEVDLPDIKVLVDSVIGPDRAFDLDALDLDPVFYPVEEGVEDELRGLKGIATDFVVSEFFTSSESLYNFLAIVHDTFEVALEIYRERRQLGPQEVFFLFKGGNVLRLLSNEFLDELPEYANRNVTEFYSPFFKRSDSDFSIYVSPDLDDYDEIFHELTVLSYRLQDRLRAVFRADMSLYFDFAKYNDAYKEKVLKAWLPKFSGDTKYVDFRPTPGGPDQTIRFVNEDYGQAERQAARAPIKNTGSIMRTTHNNALEFSNPNGGRVRFNLTRTKVHFKLTEASGRELNVPGELIDVSISHRLDNNLPHFFEDLKANVAEYALKLPNGDELKFKSLTISYLTDDLQTILFKFNALPWDDEKYAKRMNRLVYLYFVDLFIKLKNPADRHAVLTDLQSAFEELSYESLDIFEAAHGDRGLHLDDFIGFMRIVLNKVDDVETEQYDVDQLEELRQLLLTNFKVLLGALGNLHTFCVTDGKATERGIYEGKMKNLV